MINIKNFIYSLFMYNKKLYNQIITSISKVVKKQINESFRNTTFKHLNEKEISKNYQVYYILSKPLDKISGQEKQYLIDEYPFRQKFLKIENKAELQKIINNCISIFGVNCDLNWIDVSEITDMSELFVKSKFNGDISKWDVSNVTNMARIFEDSKFNGDISEWDVSNVRDMSNMFFCASFNGNIEYWDISNVVRMSHMFEFSKFNGDINFWNPASITKRIYASQVFNYSPLENNFPIWYKKIIQRSRIQINYKRQ